MINKTPPKWVIRCKVIYRGGKTTLEFKTKKGYTGMDKFLVHLKKLTSDLKDDYGVYIPIQYRERGKYYLYRMDITDKHLEQFA